jgi:hypothetical protein
MSAACIIVPVVIIALGLVTEIIMILRAPVGEEYPGIGFVRRGGKR